MTVSYQHDIQIHSSRKDGEIVVQRFPRRYNFRTLAAAFVCVTVGSLMLFHRNHEDSQEGLASYGLWGSSHKKHPHEHKHKHKHHHKHDHHEHDKYQVYPGLQLPGYPSLEAQAQYLKDLQEIDWDEVEADLDALMTDSQECK